MRFIICLCFIALTFIFSHATAEETSESENFGLKITAEKPFVENFEYYAKKQSIDLKEKSKREKILSGILFTLGISATGTAVGLVIHQYGFDKGNSSSAQFPLFFSGLTLIGTGIVSNYFSNYNNRKSIAFLDLSSQNNSPDANLMEAYNKSLYSDRARIQSAADLKSHGTSLIFVSLMSFGVNIFLYYKMISPFTVSDKKRTDEDENDSDHQFGNALANSIDALGIIGGVCIGTIALLPTMAIFASGITMHIYSSKWSKLQSYEPVISLDSISPIINPVSKTYGLSMGFSF